MTDDDPSHPAAVAERVRVFQWMTTAWLHPIDRDRYALAQAIMNGAHLVPPKTKEETANAD